MWDDIPNVMPLGVCRDCGTTDDMYWWTDRLGYWKQTRDGRWMPATKTATRCRPCWNELSRVRIAIADGRDPSIKRPSTEPRPMKVRPVVDCASCGTPFSAFRPDNRFCSDACRMKTKSGTSASRPPATCPECGSVFPQRRGAIPKVYCSSPCARIAVGRRARKPPKPAPTFSPLKFRQCKRCDAPMVARLNRKYCGDECRRLHNIARVMDLYEAAYLTGRVKVACHWFRELIGYLAERDAERCGICGKRVDITLKSGPRGDDRGPSVDHVIPRSKGGSNDFANLRLTHWRCNRKRGNRGEIEQLRLVG